MRTPVLWITESKLKDGVASSWGQVRALSTWDLISNGAGNLGAGEQAGVQQVISGIFGAHLCSQSKMFLSYF